MLRRRIIRCGLRKIGSLMIDVINSVYMFFWVFEYRTVQELEIDLYGPLTPLIVTVAMVDILQLGDVDEDAKSSAKRHKAPSFLNGSRHHSRLNPRAPFSNLRPT